MNDRAEKIKKIDEALNLFYSKYSVLYNISVRDGLVKILRPTKTQLQTELSAAQQEIERLRALVKSPKGPKCECGSIDVEMHGGGFQEADASRGLPEMDGYQMGCNSCGLVWHE